MPKEEETDVFIPGAMNTFQGAGDEATKDMRRLPTKDLRRSRTVEVEQSLAMHIKTENKCERLLIQWNRQVLHPLSNWVFVYSIISLVMITASACVVPLEVAGLKTLDDEAFIWLDVFFWFDIAMQFHIGFRHGPINVMQKKTIAIAYLKSWFIIDLIAASVPLFAYSEANTDTARLFKIFRLLRMFRFGRTLSRLSLKLRAPSVLIETAKFFFYVLVLAHALAGIFIWLHEYNYLVQPVTWMTKIGVEKSSFATKYVWAMYWSMTTMTTIGYGDVTPGNDMEVVYVICCEVVGLSVFALLLTKINELNDFLVSASDKMFKDNKDKLMAYLRRHRVDKAVSKRLLDDLRLRRIFEEQEALAALPLSDRVKIELKMAVYGPILLSMPLFGWSDDEVREYEYMMEVFEHHDKDGNKSLSKPEVTALLEDIHADSISAETVFAVWDLDKNQMISFQEFYEALFLYQHARYKLQWPLSLIDTLACCLVPNIYSQDDVVVQKGEYGKKLIFLKDFGEMQYNGHENKLKATYTAIHPDQTFEHCSKIFGQNDHLTTVNADDMVPIIGLASILNNEDFDTLVNCRDLNNVEVVASEGCSVLEVDRDAVRRSIEMHWPTGDPHLKQLVAMRYGSKQLLDPNYRAQELIDPRSLEAHKVSTNVRAQEAERLLPLALSSSKESESSRQSVVNSAGLNSSAEVGNLQLKVNAMQVKLDKLERCIDSMQLAAVETNKNTSAILKLLNGQQGVGGKLNLQNRFGPKRKSWFSRQ